MRRKVGLNEFDIWLRLARRRGYPRSAPWRVPPDYIPPSSSRHGRSGGRSQRDEEEEKGSILRKFLENGATTLAALMMLGLGGYTYHMFYKKLVLQKIENAFSSGFSSLELAALTRHGVSLSQSTRPDNDNRMFHVLRPEQEYVDAIVRGDVRGHYFLLFGEKGTGKTSMLLESMRKVSGYGVAMLEAHSEAEVFRLRLGKSLDYEYHEDYIGGLFSIKGPRDSTPSLDIERALNKLEKVALKRRKHHDRPLILIINNIHFVSDDAEGQHLMTLLQQRAELWAASGLVTVVFTSDEYRTMEMFRLHATRMQVMHVQDVPRDIAAEALKIYREQVHKEPVSNALLNEIYNKVGGRLIYLDQVARSKDMLKAANSICEKERQWLLSQCWILGKEMDDKAEDQQDYCAAAMILAQALVALETESKNTQAVQDLPRIPLHRAQELMTRADFLRKLDEMNIIAIDADGSVRADSVPMQNAFRMICTDPRFPGHLEATIERLDELESLGRTTELTMKDLVDGQFKIKVEGNGSGRADSTIIVRKTEKRSYLW